MIGPEVENELLQVSILTEFLLSEILLIWLVWLNQTELQYLLSVFLIINA